MLFLRAILILSSMIELRKNVIHNIYIAEYKGLHRLNFGLMETNQDKGINKNYEKFYKESGAGLELNN